MEEEEKTWIKIEKDQEVTKVKQYEERREVKDSFEANNSLKKISCTFLKLQLKHISRLVDSVASLFSPFSPSVVSTVGDTMHNHYKCHKIYTSLFSD